MKLKNSMLKFLSIIGLAAYLIGCGGGGQKSTGKSEHSSESTESHSSSAPAKSIGTSSITGTILFSGNAPKMKSIDMSAEATCSAKHGGNAKSESLVLGDGNAMANVFVKVTSGLPANASYEAPEEAAVLDQVGCVYKPHVIGVMVEQPVLIKNSDGIMHNVHAFPEKNAEFNKAMPRTRTELPHTFDEAENMFPIKCDVHPWMVGYIAVMSHPFFDVTGTDGKFELKDLPAGTYELEAWHEKLGTKSETITVGDGESQRADFTFSRS